MAVARGLAIVKPEELFLVKLCNFDKDQVIVRKNSTLKVCRTLPRADVGRRLG